MSPPSPCVRATRRHPRFSLTREPHFPPSPPSVRAAGLEVLKLTDYISPSLAALSRDQAAPPPGLVVPQPLHTPQEHHLRGPGSPRVSTELTVEVLHPPLGFSRNCPGQSPLAHHRTARKNRPGPWQGQTAQSQLSVSPN